MMKKLIFMLFALILLAGCKTTEIEETKPLSWKQRQAYLAKMQDPRTYGMGIYDTPAGPQIRGGGRLHPSQSAALPMLTKEEETLRPVVGLAGNFGLEWPVLLDFASSRTWLEFTVAKKLMAHPVGEREAELIRLPDEEVAACLSTVSALRFGQLFIEHPLVYVRLADGSLGPLTRGIVEPQLKGVIGWDLLKKVEQIHLLYSIGQVALLSTDPYDPDPGQLLAILPIVQHAGACLIRGTVDGQDGLILIDPAGDFEVATEGGVAVASIQLGSEFILEAPVVSESPGGTRLGARWLKNYDVTICPKAGVVYFGKQDVREEK